MKGRGLGGSKGVLSPREWRRGILLAAGAWQGKLQPRSHVQNQRPPSSRVMGHLRDSNTGVTLMLKINKSCHKRGRHTAIVSPQPADVGWPTCARSCGRGPGGELPLGARAMQSHTWEPGPQLQRF